MRLLALVAIASLAIANPGCIFIGATVGSAIPVTQETPRDPAKPHHASRGTYTLVGAGIGLLVDVLVVWSITSTLDSEWNKVLHANDSCPTCD